jgi:hypothetical protein
MYDITFRTFSEFEHRIVKTHMTEDPVIRLVGLLFMRSGQETAEKDIVPSLDYFSERSGQYVHFFLPGWYKRHDTWIFTAKDFTRECDILAEETNWRYSGGTELLLFTTRKLFENEAIVDFSGVINIALHELKMKKSDDSAELIFERIFSFVRNYKGADPLLGIAAQEARVSAVDAVINGIIGLLPKEFKDRADYAKQFAIKDVSKAGRTTESAFRQIKHFPKCA